METKTRYRFAIEAFVILVRICVGIVWASAGPLLPFLMQEFSISRGQAGWYASAAPIAVAVLAVPIGVLGARFSLKKTFAVGALLQAAGIFAPFCDSYPLIILTRVVYALGTAITVPLASSILADWFTSRELPFVNGITVSFVTLGNTVAFVATVPLATFLSWSAPITAYGAFALTCALAWMIFGRDRAGKLSINKQAAGTSGFDKSELSLKAALKQRSTIILMFSVMGAWCLGNAIGSWLPTYYHEVFNMSLTKASSIASIVTITGVVASITGGIISMRTGRRKPLLLFSGMFMGITALFSVLFNVPAVIFISVALFGFFGNLQNAATYTIPVELPNVSPRTGSIIFSFMLAGGNFGNFMGPLIVGYAVDITGSYLPGFIICAVLSLSLFAAGLMLPETGPGRQKAITKPVPAHQT